MNENPNDESRFRFVLLRHEFGVLPAQPGRLPHWDLMIQFGTQLETWAIETDLCDNRMVRGTQLANHRVAYLDYEGPVSNDRGFVQRVDRGPATWIKRESGLKIVKIEGERICGQLHFHQSDTAESTEDRDSAHLWQIRLIPFD